ncbi:PAS domain S-box-containing protein [Roseovarius azorensis]|uniref:histidine kinase n=1 Tax=Roseovarius azorensis TaxID=1287727 RepID=A0A1H7N6P4_9RHOB|nr:ATP-binding protein [Roseovarius azorensis]SEL19282.1 PAS domain S-box-containing protein [Roseovarius azorensis]
MTSIKRTYKIATAAALLVLVTVTTGIYLGAQTRAQFNDIAKSWTDYAEDPEKKGVWISSLRGYLGYGGIIHNFKNYVIRKDESYRTRMLDQITQFDAVMASYLSEPLPDVERRALETIRVTIGEYRARLGIADRAVAGNWPAERTDRLVRVDDTEAVLALRNLEILWMDSRARSTARIIAAVTRGEMLIGYGFLAMVLLAAAALTIAVLIGVLIRDMRAANLRLTQELGARRTLERSEQRLAQAVEQSPATILITDTSERIQYVNRRFEDVSGWTRAEIIGRTPRLLRSGETSDNVHADLRKTLERGEIWRGVLHNRRRDGGSYWVDSTILPLRAEDGSIHSYVGIGEDITEKRQVREQMVRAQKIEAVGLLAGGIAHDFNNILTAILGSTHLASLDADPGSDLAQEVEQIDIAARRAQALVRQLLGFARREPGTPVATDLCIVMAEVERLLRAAIPPTIRIEGVKDCVPVTVLADPTHLHQILMNLCTNAAEAIGDADGHIRITARALADTPEGLSTRTQGWTELTVEDTGIGMSDETAARIFDAFYTTKPLGRGTGLGLCVVQGLVQDIGGRVTVESAPGNGTRFRILMPGAAAAQAAQSAASPAPERGHESLLIVDDQTEVAATLRRGLIRMGYQVEAYTSARIALDRFEKTPARHSLLISDVIMPEMNGIEMARAMRALRPDLPVILCTGFTPTDVILPGGPTEVLAKPLDPLDLARHVRRMLDASRAA